jgi:hypothetical protein
LASFGIHGGGGYELDTSTAIAPGSWTNALQVPDLANGTNVVEVPIDSQARFFRLGK